MAATLHVDVVSAEGQFYSGPATFIVLPGEQGELGIYPRHTQLITRIRPGVVRIQKPGVEEEEFLFVAGGLLEVQPDNVTVLADTVIRGKDLDEARANQARELAEEKLSQHQGEIDYAKVQAELAAAVAQLAAIARWRAKHHQ